MTGIVVPIHNGIQYTVKCLKSLERLVFQDYTVFVVDDGSTDGSAEVIRSAYPYVATFRGNGELWWSGAMNLGIEHALRAGAEYVLALNNDNVVDPFSLTYLVETARQNPHCIVGSMVYFLDRPTTIRYGGGKLNWMFGTVSETHFGEEDSGAFSKTIEVDWLGGMGVLIPTTVFTEVGYFDTKTFPHYSGDEDLWLRARRRGYSLLLDPRSKLWVHEEQRGVKLRQNSTVIRLARRLFDVRFHGNVPTTLRFFWRHCPWYALPTGLVCHFLTNAYRLIRSIIRAKTDRNGRAVV